MDTKVLASLGARLKEARRRKHLTQGKVGEYIGVTHGTIGQWERDETIPTLDNLVGVAELFGSSLDWLIWGMNNSIDARLRALPRILRDPLVMQFHQQIDAQEVIARQLPPEITKEQVVGDHDKRLRGWAKPKPVRRGGGTQ